MQPIVRQFRHGFLNIRMPIAVFLLVLIDVAPAVACGGYSLGRQYYPNPPAISMVNNTHPMQYSDTFTVTAEVEPGAQFRILCDNPPNKPCTAMDWYRVMDGAITPNPPDLLLVRVYYYRKGDIGNTRFVDMERDADTGLWSAEVPVGDAAIGDTFFYYIAAMDSMGNVSSQAPDPNARACTTTDDWDPDYATPAMGLCMDSPEDTKCYQYVNRLAPRTCADSTFTVNDMRGDVCGEIEPCHGDLDFSSGTCGVQQPYSRKGAEKLDLLGLSVSASPDRVCARLGLDAVESSLGPSPIKSYAVLFIQELLRTDCGECMGTEPVYVAAYMPQMGGTDCLPLTNTVFNGDCLMERARNADYDGVLECWVQTGSNNSDFFDVAIGGGALTMSISERDTNTGYARGDGYDLMAVPSGNQRTIILAMTTEFVVGQDTWVTDATPALAFYHKNQAAVVLDAPAPPGDMEITCLAPGAQGSSNRCPFVQPAPQSNTCALSFSPVPAAGPVQYRIYRADNEDAKNAVLMGTQDDTGLSRYVFNDSIQTLEGDTYYYWLTTFDVGSGRETPRAHAAAGQCTVMEVDPLCSGASCVTFSTCSENGVSCTPLAAVDPSILGSDGRYAKIPLEGRNISLLDSNGNLAAPPVATAAQGQFQLSLDTSTLWLGENYSLVLNLEGEDRNRFACDSLFESAGCFMLLKQFALQGAARSQWVRVSPPALPMPGGGRAEIGNPDCNTVVDISDMVLLKPAFGKERGTAEYRTYLDFNGDGQIDISDYLLLKNNYGRSLPGAPAPHAELCKP
jgi:hypothetical protein